MKGQQYKKEDGMTCSRCNPAEKSFVPSEYCDRCAKRSLERRFDEITSQHVCSDCWDRLKQRRHVGHRPSLSRR